MADIKFKIDKLLEAYGGRDTATISKEADIGIMISDFFLSFS